MVLYRRNRVEGGTYFFTVTLADRRSRLLVEHGDLLREAFSIVRKQRPFTIVAISVMPEHIHAIWTLPEGDADYSGHWRAIKSRFTRSLSGNGGALSRNRKGEHAVWQRRFWEHTIRDDEDLARHVAYIHYNPVKHGLVKQVKDWPLSSFHRFVREGLLDEDWAGGDVEGDFGE
jgi:putative transposase